MKKDKLRGRFIEKGLIKVRVGPNSDREELKEEEGELKLYVKARAEKGKANSAVVRFFKKELGLRVRIKSGLKSREKAVRRLGSWEQVFLMLKRVFWVRRREKAGEQVSKWVSRMRRVWKGILRIQRKSF